MAYKRHLIAKTKNLFDVSKVVTSDKITVKNGVITCSDYGVSIGQVKTLCPSLKAGDTVKLLLKGTYTSNKDVNYVGCFIYLDGVKTSGVTITVTQETLDETLYLYKAANVETATRYPDSKGIYYNITITKDLNQSETISYGYLPSYKSKLKVANVCQLVNLTVLSETKNGVAFTNNGNGTATVDGTATTLTEFKLQNANFLKEHVYLLKGCPSGGMAGTYMFDTGAGIGNDIGNGVISKPTLVGERYVSIYVWGGTVCTNLVFKPQLIDLTEMYGAGHEPTTVAEFRAKFPNELYPYAPKCWLTSYKHNLIATTKNICDFNKLFSLPVINTWVSIGFYEVKITGLEPNTAYTFSRANNKQIKLNNSATYLGIVNHDGDPTKNTYWLNHDSIEALCNKSQTLNSNENGELWIYYNFATSVTKSEFASAFGYIQLEKGSTATDYVPNEYL